MSKEPYYRIRIWKNDEITWTKEIPESELKRRIAIIRGLNPDYPDQILNIEIDILLHGGGEKRESNFGHFLETCKDLDKQPSPAPTREEWKLWIQDLPRPATVNSWLDAWLDEVEIWLEHGPWMRGK